VLLNYNTKVKASKTAGEYILPVKKKQITENKKADLEPRLFNLVIPVAPHTHCLDFTALLS